MKIDITFLGFLCFFSWVLTLVVFTSDIGIGFCAGVSVIYGWALSSGQTEGERE